MESLYATGAQLVPVLLIVMAVDLRREAIDFFSLRRFLILAGVAEAACFVGMLGLGVPRPDWLSPALPWAGAAATALLIMWLVIETLLSLWRHRRENESDHYTKEIVKDVEQFLSPPRTARRRRRPNPSG